MVAKKEADQARQDRITRVNIAYFEKAPPSDSVSCQERIS
jgi:hypothetical protein